ncbi:efflux RND transporter permease subunit [Rheinheimera faecalis]|uniref:efflux RND transporter permease subunit n=1 Tax=Rheinheimera faecalis TaxID=2901141 RepID=UPI001E4B0C6A|nr:efflux RND transporter permease subunit [Rheinheimera faecalis]
MLLNAWFNRPFYGVLSLALILMAGVAAFIHLPVALLPDIDKPVLKITTQWSSASAQEIQDYLITPQERALKGISNLHQVISKAYRGRAEIELTFDFNTNIDRAFMDVQQRLSMVRSKPEDALPTIIERSGSEQTLVFMFAQNTNNNQMEIDEYEELLETEVLNKLMQIDGVSHAKLSLASEQELHVVVDMDKLASYGLRIDDIKQIMSLNKNVSAGVIGAGKTSYELRYEGEKDKFTLGQTPLPLADGARIKLSDVADILQTRSRRQHFVIQNDHPAIGIHVFKTPEANLLGTLEKVSTLIQQLNQGVLEKHGIKIEKSFDPSVFINRSVDLVISNLVIGTFLAFACLFWFYRRRSATVLISCSIVNTLLATFIVMYLFNRNLNIISLAGIALATGVILDSSIIIFDSITKQFKQGIKGVQGIILGCIKVQSALISSVVTSIVIFLPLLLVNSFEGRIFSDLAFTISVAIGLSFIFSTFFFPLAFIYFPHVLEKPVRQQHQGLELISTVLLAAQHSRERSKLVLVAIVVLVVLVFSTIVPKIDLLPPMRRDAIDSLLIINKGANLDYLEKEIGYTVVERLQPYIHRQKEPHLANYYVAVSPDFTALGVRALHSKDTEAVKALISSEILKDLPGVASVTYQASLFGALESARSISMDLAGNNVERLFEHAAILKKRIVEQIPGADVRILPKPEFDVPRLSVSPDYQKSSQLKVDLVDVLATLEMAGDGLYVGRLSHEGKIQTVRLKMKGVEHVSDLNNISVINADNELIPYRELVTSRTDVTVSELRKVNFQTTATLMVVVPDHWPMGDAAELLQSLADHFNQQAHPDLSSASIGGASDMLNEAIDNLLIQFAFTFFVFLLLMFLTFKSMKYALVITLTLPVASIGGFIGLAVNGLFYPVTLDLLTLLGFVILIGLVINNSILYIGTYQQLLQQGQSVQDALRGAFEDRLLPISVSTATTIAGMLPLAFIPGEGSELYRGLGIVIVSGMSIGSLLLMLIIPSLLNLLDSPTHPAEAPRGSDLNIDLSTGAK